MILSGDGTKANRVEALAAASRMYEEEFAKGPVKNLLTGSLLSLLLIQIQQLKAGNIDHTDCSNSLRGHCCALCVCCFIE